MNPVAYRIAPNEPLNFLLIGVVVHSERLWMLNIYATPRQRLIEARKLKRKSADVIFIEWDVAMNQILKEGKIAFPVTPTKVLTSDKLDIFRQLSRGHK